MSATPEPNQKEPATFREWLDQQIADPILLNSWRRTLRLAGRPIMKLENTKRLATARSTDEVNVFIENGWVFIQIYIVDHGMPGAPSGEPHFIMAWMKDGEPVYPVKAESSFPPE